MANIPISLMFRIKIDFRNSACHIPGIGLGPHDARFCTLNYKIAHNFNGECAIFASKVVYLINR